MKPLIKTSFAREANNIHEGFNFIPNKQWMKAWIEQVNSLKSKAEVYSSGENDREDFCYYLHAAEKN